MPLLHASKKTLLLALGLTAALGSAGAQEAPPIKMLVGFAAGGSTDAVARLLAQGLQRELSRSVMVENRPGAGGQIAAQALKAARPDGQTLFFSNSHTLAMIPLTVLKPGFGPGDFAPVGLVSINPDVFVLSTARLPDAGMGPREFARWSRSNPGQGNVGIPAPASAPDFAIGVVAKALDADLKAVPYRGDGPVAQDVMAGQITAGIGSVGAMLQPADAGKLRMLAVNGTQRLPLIPHVPTYAELGIPGYEEVIYTAVFAPAGTPAPLLERYSQAIAKVVRSSEFDTRLAGLGLTAASSTPAELGARLESTRATWKTMVKNAGFQAQ